MVPGMGYGDYQPTAERRYGRVGWFALATGLNLAIAACSLICKSPQSLTFSWETRVFRSAFYLLLACLMGATGTWMLLPSSSDGRFRALYHCGARGWIFLPATILFLQQESVFGPLVAVLGAASMAAYLFRFTGVMPKGARKIPRSQRYLERVLFTTQVRLAPTSWIPFGLSLCFYGAFLSAVTGSLILVTLLLVTATFLIVLQIVRAQIKGEQGDPADRRSRPYSLIGIAFCCVFVALSASSSRLTLQGWRRSPPSGAVKQPVLSPHASSGYHTIVLWPIQKKENVIPSPPVNTTALASGMAKPWIIPFYGPYWYFKFAGESPGPTARTARGDPLKVNIRSTDASPLLMEAHQHLSEPIDMACCRAMQTVLTNDASLGAIAVGLSLTDTQSKGAPSQSLGVKFATSNGADQRAEDSASIEETLMFLFPKARSIQRFDAITVTLLPDATHRTVGRKVAVERFVMLPN